MRHLTLPDSNVTSAKTKLPQQAIPARQANEHAGVTELQIRPDKNRSFCPSAAKMNGSSPLSRPKETIIRAAPPHSHEIPSKMSIPRLRKREESLVMSRRGQNERFFAIHTPRPTYAPLRASVQLVRSGHRAWRGRQSAAPCESRTMPIAECASGTWGRAGAGAAANRPPPAHRAPCPWPNAHRAPGAARAQALPHPGRRAWCAPP